MSRYRKSYPDVRTLICFVYDLGERVENPAGLTFDLNDLSDESLLVETIVCPR